ncbi:MAG: sodium:sulfate symporter [Melioribacteraceae bacterium]|nr:MAG: sodium:sulfate symporter [Melioribacteraceae bacterium]
MFDFWFTLALFLILTLVLVKEWVFPEIALFSVLMLLVVGKVITVEEALSGFANEAMLIIGLLFVIAGSFKSTGILDKIADLIFTEKKVKYPSTLVKLLFPLAGLSAFLNNTPIVAMIIPVVKKWAEKNEVSVSKFLIPISYATIFGGMCTLIGTSTNLIIHGLMIENGIPGFSFFELSIVGIPLTIVGIGYLILFGEKLLPDSKLTKAQIGESTREFVIELKVTDQFAGIGKSVEDAGLRHLTGLYLFQIERNGEILTPVGPDETIFLEDRLFFTGLPKTIIELQKTKGLELLKHSHFDLKYYDSDKIKSYEVVVSPGSKFLGKNPRELKFREKYGAVILAIHRNGERIKKKIGDIRLKAGDTLLLLAGKDFKSQWYNSEQFSLVSVTEQVPSKPRWHGYFSVLVFITLLVLATLGIIPLVSAVGISAVLLILTRSITGNNIIYSIDFKVLIVIASSFGIAIAMEKSGVGDFFANMIINFAGNFGTLAVMVSLFVLTVLYTNFITNNTAAVMMFPIAYSLSVKMGIGIHPLAVLIAIGASNSFATPISYQTNLMVYGPGGYRFKDYFRIGFPLQILLGVLSIAIIYLFLM